MALINLNFFSESLGMQTEVLVVMPQRSTVGEIGVESKVEQQKYKCLYLLHGLSDDQSNWLRRTSIERYAAEYGLCVVMPCAHKSFYTDMKYGNKYYTYIAKELPSIIREFFNVSDKREDNFLAGNSMGGYGALKIALRNTEVFGAVAGLSSVADIRCNLFTDVKIPIFGEELQISDEEDLFWLAQAHNDDANKPRICMIVGTEDYLYQDNVRLKEAFRELDYDYTYVEEAGDHCWEFWDKHILNVLKWMMEK